MNMITSQIETNSNIKVEFKMSTLKLYFVLGCSLYGYMFVINKS